MRVMVPVTSRLHVRGGMGNESCRFRASEKGFLYGLQLVKIGSGCQEEGRNGNGIQHAYSLGR